MLKKTLLGASLLVLAAGSMTIPFAVEAHGDHDKERSLFKKTMPKESMPSIKASSSQISIGSLAPDFKLQAQDGSWKSLQDYKDQWVVLYFYPKDDTPSCTTEAKNFRDAYANFKELNAEIVGVSLDDNSSHKDFSKQYKLPFPLLSDTEQKAAKQYNVLTSFGAVKYTKRQTFIIDPQGNIVYHFKKVSPDAHSDNVLSKLTELKKSLES